MDTILREVAIRAGDVQLGVTLGVPAEPHGIVLFAHGSGSSRHSPRNKHVAHVLQGGGFATLLMDLLTREEELVDARTGHLRFNISLLAERLVGATDWVASQRALAELPIGYFGASTGAAAALIAAAQRPGVVLAVVSRGGRPDLAATVLPRLRVPTLLIVGGADTSVIRINQDAFELMRMPDRQLQIVPGAGHLFEEPGALDRVAGLARNWFAHHLALAKAIA